MSHFVGPVVVFGAAGQVGRELLKKPSIGLPVVGFTHGDVDISDAAAVRVVISRIGPSVIVNAAAYTAVDKAESDAERAFAVNEQGARNLAQAAQSHGSALIHISTDYVFDGRKREPYLEDDPVNPLSVYGRSKQAGERLVAAECERHIILRTAWVCGMYGSNFVKTMLRLADERDVVRVVADQRGTPTSAGDLAAAIFAIITMLSEGHDVFGTFHLTNSGATTWHGVAAHIFAWLAANGGVAPRLDAITTAEYPTPAARPSYSILDCGRILQAYGVALRPWERALDDILSSLHNDPAEQQWSGT
ncbi:dTDP-4-dehydrorhamnose reductase [Bradyrhizobium algeriense]|uniref:dTDP-4-dehydrorhamnose reductase n=1 Tax=Bradyrhizobium algeriense TaxID=634784 RepID=UPI000D34DEAA|nr:dTDP-4-dehydrorhamnose reductase [Bradyrhizobium algeriense]